MHSDNIDLNEWTKIKDRGALTKFGAVYRSCDGMLILRTGNAELITSEAEYSADAGRRGFPVPELVATGILPSGMGYFIERSVGERTFAEILRREYEEYGRVSDESFQNLTNMAGRLLAAQIAYGNRQHDTSQLRLGIQLPNVLHENSDVSPDLLESVVAKVEDDTSGLPVVLSHGDFAPFNILAGGIIDFECRFIAPAGYDVIRCLIFHRLWDFPQPDGTGTNALWEFSPSQMSGYLREMDQVCAQSDVPPVSPFLDAFLVLNAIWALCYERTEDRHSPQFWRWQWRKRVAVHCAERFLAGTPIDMGDFRRIGFEA